MSSLIAITPCARPHDYEASVVRAGGRVRALDLLEDAPAGVVHAVSGVLLTGGGDVDPALYGAPRHGLFNPAEPGRDAFEIELVRRALALDLPVFAICRGVQVLNVALGGTLVQHIPAEVDGALGHAVEDPPSALAHEARIAGGSLLARLLRHRADGDTCAVNSRHHQAVKAAGGSLVVVATAPDGVIEAVEDPTRRFCLGVQWHPENFVRTGEFRTLFDAFVDAARTYAPHRSGGSTRPSV